MKNIIEEKTPKGICFKILLDKWKFLAFDRNGTSIYADDYGMKVLHRIPTIVFLSERFIIKNNYRDDLSLFRVKNEKLVIPYRFPDKTMENYLFISFSVNLDLYPVRILTVKNIAQLVRDLDSEQNIDYIVVDEGITKNDIVIIKGRYPAALIILAQQKSDITEVKKNESLENEESNERATDLLKDVNLNMMSQNPVFLSRVHLRRMELSKVKQLLLDFDLNTHDTEYIITFINTMLNKADASDEIKKEERSLKTLKISFQFYIYLINRIDDGIKDMISKAMESDELAFFSTLLAKVREQFTQKEDLLTLTKYENLIEEAKANISKK